jgi:hypothetical protein
LRHSALGAVFVPGCTALIVTAAVIVAVAAPIAIALMAALAPVAVIIIAPLAPVGVMAGLVPRQIAPGLLRR